MCIAAYVFVSRMEIAPANKSLRMSFQWSCKDEKALAAQFF